MKLRSFAVSLNLFKACFSSLLSNHNAECHFPSLLHSTAPSCSCEWGDGGRKQRWHHCVVPPSMLPPRGSQLKSDLCGNAPSFSCGLLHALVLQQRSLGWHFRTVWFTFRAIWTLLKTRRSMRCLCGPSPWTTFLSLWVGYLPFPGFMKDELNTLFFHIVLAGFQKGE